MNRKPAPRFPAWAVAASVALVVRVLMIIWSHAGPYVQSPSGMSELYFQQGYAIAAGLGFAIGMEEADDYLEELHRAVDSGTLVATPESIPTPPDGLLPDTLHPPGMSLLVAGVHRLMKMPADLPVQILGAVLDSIAAALVTWIGTSVATAGVGLVAGLLYAVFLPQAWASTGALMPDGLIGPFVVAMVAAYVRALQSTGTGAYRWYLLAGLSLGVGSYLRPDYLLVPIAMFPFLWACSRKLRTSVLATIVVMTTALATLSPWAYRNHELFGAWTFTSTGAGATLVTGLAEFSNPWGFGATDTDRHREAQAEGFLSAWVPEADAYFRRVWWDSIEAEPAAFVVAMLKRLPLALFPPFEFGYANPLKTRTFTEARESGVDRYEALRTEPAYVIAAYWDNLLMAAMSAVALAATVIWLIAKRRAPAIPLLVISPHAYSIATHLIIHIEPRFLLPSFFALLIGLAFCLTRMPEILRGLVTRS